MLKRLGRLFIIKNRFEAWVVTYAIAVGAVERGQRYLSIFPGTFGWIMAAACTGVVFLAGAKLLDAVRPAPAKVRLAAPYPPRRRDRTIVNRNRPRRSSRYAAASAASPRID